MALYVFNNGHYIFPSSVREPINGQLASLPSTDCASKWFDIVVGFTRVDPHPPALERSELNFKDS